MIQPQSLNILCAGECMLELCDQGDKLNHNFAGDVINFSIYLKRQIPSASVQFFSAVGTDKLSQDMLDYLDEEGIDTTLVFRSAKKNIGVYMISKDEEGERIFSYWRSDSAARQMMSLADYKLINKKTKGSQYFYFSGITLAILGLRDKELLFSLARDFRDKGKTIIFDPNYRTGLWKKREDIQDYIRRAYTLSDIVLSSYQAEQAIFGDMDKNKILNRFKKYNVDEVVLTDGPGNITGIYHGELFEVEPQEPEKVVDTTSAGDAFNAGYLAARHMNLSPQEAIHQASSLASRVVAHPGAILPVTAHESGLWA